MINSFFTYLCISYNVSAKKMDREITDHVFEKYQANMVTTQLPPKAAKRAELFFEVFIEKTTGKTYKEYLKEQEEMRTQIVHFKKQIEKAEQEKLLLEQKAEQEKQNLICELSKILPTNSIAVILKTNEEEVIKIVNEYQAKKNDNSK